MSFLIFCMLNLSVYNFAVVQSLSRVSPFATPWTVACHAPLFSTVSQSLLKIMSTELVMLSVHLILGHSLLLLPSIFPSIRVFSNESTLCIRWPKYWSFSFHNKSSKNIHGWFPLGLASLNSLQSNKVKVLKFPYVIVDLSISPCSSIRFCFTYSDTLYHCVMTCYIPDKFCSEATLCINIATLTFFWLVLMWYARLHPFVFNLHVPLYLKWDFCRHYRAGYWFLIHSDSLWLSISIFRPLMLKMTIDIVGLISTMLVIIFYFLLSIFAPVFVL